LDHRIYKVLMLPTRGIVKAVNVAAQTLLRSISKVVGTEVIADAIAFFGAFEGMEQGFKERAAEVDSLLSQPDTAFILIASPHADTMAEAQFFAARLRELKITVRALIVNRMQPRFGDNHSPEDLAERYAGTPLGEQYQCLAEAQHLARGEQKHLLGLAQELAPAPVVQVPVQAFEVSNMATLQMLGQAMFDTDVTSEP
jgi:anion-transporting  ArsA/GET3 family ATPase